MSDLVLRTATPDDVQPLAELWAHAFPGERTVADRVRQLEAGVPYGGLETAWVLEERGRLVGAFKAYRFREHVAGAPLPMLGLAAVAVAPTARRRGLGVRLCRDALRVGRERGDAISVLYPFRPSFYQSLGWGMVGELHALTLSPAALPDTPGAAAVRLARAEDRAAIAHCYARAAACSNGLIERDTGIWTHHFTAPGTHAFLAGNTEADAYLLCRYLRSRAPERATLRVQELVATSDDGYRALVGWLAAQRDQWARVRYDARPDEPLAILPRELRPPGFRLQRRLWFPTARVLRGPMLRVLDARAALAARAWGIASARLRIEIADAELPQNRGPWTVTLENGSCTVEENTRGSATAALAADAATFAQIYAGEVTVSAAVRAGVARTEGNVLLLDRAFAGTQRFWLLDEF